MEGSASPRKPWVTTVCRSESSRSFDVACRSIARSASPRSIPVPSSVTRTNVLPPPSISMETVCAPASREFSSSPLITDAGLSTTSPAAILLTRSSPSRSTRLTARPGSKPVLALEPEHERRRHRQHGPDDDEVPVLPAQLRHVVEVHAVDAGDDGEGHEQRADDGQALHRLVETVADRREIRVHRALRHVLVGHRPFHDAVQVVVDVAEVDGSAGADHLEIRPGQPVDDLALGQADAPQLHDVLLEREDAVQRLPRWLLEDLHLHHLDLVLDGIEA